MSLNRFVTLTLATMLLAAGPAAAQSVLRIGLNDDPDALDPTISRAYTGRLVFAAVCDKLFDVTPELKIVPQLAISFEWAADQRSVVIKLRPGVKFHDGEPFNAEAVKFNIERHINTTGSFRKTEIGQIARVDVLDDTTVRLNLSEPLVPLLAALTDRAGMMVSPKAARTLGDKFGTRPVCAGPQVRRAWPRARSSSSGSLTTDKGNIHIDRVSSCPSSTRPRLASLRSGDLHMIERLPPIWRRSAGTAGQGGRRPELGHQMIPLNVTTGPRARRRRRAVRQAIDLAIDRDAVKAVFNNEYIPITSGSARRARTTTPNFLSGSATWPGPASF
jgi:peptide/nickel transport system substrate-binding protein